MNEGSRERTPGLRQEVLRASVAIALLGVTLLGLATQAVNADRTVNIQADSATALVAAEQNAFYDCLDIQARSLISPDQPVTMGGSTLSDYITLVQTVYRWITLASPPTRAVAELYLRTGVSGPGTCRGTVVMAHYAHPKEGPAVRRGSGASVRGHGGPPPTPL